MMMPENGNQMAVSLAKIGGERGRGQGDGKPARVAGRMKY